MKTIALIVAFLSLVGLWSGSAKAQNKSVPNLTSATLPLSGSELMYIVQGGNDRKTPASTFLGVTTSPGGASGSIQYNNSGAFGGYTIGSGLSVVGGALTATVTGTTPPGGATGSIQYNDSGSFGGLNIGTNLSISGGALNATFTGGISSITTTGTSGAASLTTSTNLNVPNYAITLTTTGSSGAATASGLSLNIPQYAGGGGSTSLSSLTSSTTINSFDNANLAQTWSWNTLTTQNALTLTSTPISSGRILNVTAGNGTNSSGYAGYFSMSATGSPYALYSTMTGTANTGYAGYFNNTATTGYAAYINGPLVINSSYVTPNIITQNGVFGLTNPINNQGTTTPYAVLTSDMTKTIVHSKSTAVSETLSVASTSGFGSGAAYTSFNQGVGAVTITPTTSTINGASTLVLNQYQGAFIFSDGTNYNALIGGAQSDFDYLSTAQSFSKSKRGAQATIAISTSTFTPDFNAAQHSSITLVNASCPCTIANPSNVASASGQTGILKIKQSSTGNDTIGTWGSVYKFASGTPPSLSTGANAIDYLSYYVDDSTHVVISAGVLNAQ